MSGIIKAYFGAQIHDGYILHDGDALAVDQNGCLSVQPRQAVLLGCQIVELDGGLISPGFVDLQVNGGGGVMFNNDPSIGTLRIIAQAHAKMGTHALLPTLITDTPARTRAAIEAVTQAMDERVAGIVGLHLEDPHLSVSQKGAHDAKLIRPMAKEDLTLILAAMDRMPNVMVTVAPENTTLAQIRTMSAAGVIVSLRHTDADAQTYHAAFDAGARCVTHLFNAMSQLGNREPGLVGATLERGDVYAGLIADGIHVHPSSIRIALAAKQQSEKVYLVTDAVAKAGSEIIEFSLNGREVFRKDSRLTLADNTLAGADLEMGQSLRVMTEIVQDDACNAIARATSTPASLLRENSVAGRFSGTQSQAIFLDAGFKHSALFPEP